MLFCYLDDKNYVNIHLIEYSTKACQKDDSFGRLTIR